DCEHKSIPHYDAQEPAGQPDVTPASEFLNSQRNDRRNFSSVALTDVSIVDLKRAPSCRVQSKASQSNHEE
ncbi:hypothetical protein KUCAC02_037075, partial [Chaenocephalus aceratus]